MPRRPKARDLIARHHHRPAPAADGDGDGDGPIPLNASGPDVDVLPRLPLEEIPTGPEHARRMGFPEDVYLRRYRLRTCSVIVTRELGTWHLSIAHPWRYPAWDEIAQARYRLLPHVRWMAMYLPPKSAYVNAHRNCFQLYECPPPPGEDP